MRSIIDIWSQISLITEVVTNLAGLALLKNRGCANMTDCKTGLNIVKKSLLQPIVPLPITRNRMYPSVGGL